MTKVLFWQACKEHFSFALDYKQNFTRILARNANLILFMQITGKDLQEPKKLLSDDNSESQRDVMLDETGRALGSEEALVETLTRDFADATKNPLSLKNVHLPVAPKEGFSSAAEFLDFVTAINVAMAADYQQYLVRKDELRARDPEQPDKFIASIVTECADGRNSELQFMGADELLGRFDHEWLPFAGNIIFPEFKDLQKVEDWAAYMESNPQMKEKFFARLDFIYGHKIEEAVAEFRAGTLSRVNLEFQSHYDAEHFPKHGCGAHNSDLLAAQLESIKDCLVADSWLAGRYPEEYQAGLFRVVHTTHDTSDHGGVYRADKVNLSLPQESQEKYGDLFFYSAQKFELPKIKDEATGLVREYKGNPFEIETEDHDEQSVRISDMHYASTLKGQSVMEVTWTDDAETLAQHVKILLGIIGRNFQTRNPEKPAIVHFDLVKGDEKMAEVYKNTKAILGRDAELVQKQREGLLLMVLTETDRRDYHMEIVQ